MNYLYFSVFAILISSSPLSAKVAAIKYPVNLFCGHIHYGCEDVDTNTFKIEILSADKVQVIRQFHRSDLPITSAFIGKFSTPTTINAKFDTALTKKNFRIVQEHNAEGEIVVTLKCANIATYKDCKVSAVPAATNKALDKFPGWDKTEGDVENLSCNLKNFTTDTATAKDCTDE